MKKLFAAITISLISVFLLTSCGDQKSEDKIYFATSADYPPFQYKQRGELLGFEIDLAKLIAQKMDKEAEFQEMSFSTVLVAVKSGMVDAGIATITATEERAKNFDFSDPYFKDELAIVYRLDKPILDKNSLEDKRVACQLGTTMEIWLKKNAKQSEILTIDTNPDAIESLKAGHVDAVLVDAVQADQFTKSNHDDLGYNVVAKADDGYAIAFKIDSPLRDKVNDALKQLEAEGEIEKLKGKYIESEQWKG